VADLVVALVGAAPVVVATGARSRPGRAWKATSVPLSCCRVIVLGLVPTEFSISRLHGQPGQDRCGCQRGVQLLSLVRVVRGKRAH
jgi:hypothetical protein